MQAVPGIKTTYELVKPGSGKTVTKGTTVTVHATGIVKQTGKKFWQVLSSRLASTEPPGADSAPRTGVQRTRGSIPSSTRLVWGVLSRAGIRCAHLARFPRRVHHALAVLPARFTVLEDIDRS